MAPRVHAGTARSLLSLRYIDDLVALSDTHAWTYVELPPTPWELLSDEHRITVAGQITLALAGLVTHQEPVEVHLRVAYREHDVFGFARRASEHVYDPAPGLGDYLRRQVTHLADKAHLDKVVLLGVCLGSRNGGSGRNTVLDQITRLTTRAHASLGLDDPQVPAKELQEWRRKADEVRRALAGAPLNARPALADTVSWLIRHTLHPEMPDPDPGAADRRPWGRGELEMLTEGFITNQHRWLRVEQSAGEGYVAHLGLARFPDTMHFPNQEPWLHYASALPFPVEVSLRATLVPPRKVKSDVARQAQYAKDMATHMGESGNSLPLVLQEQLDTAESLEYAITKKQQPFAYTRTRLRVTAADAEELTARVRAVIDHYRDLGIDVTWPTGDQLDLLLESMPADRVRLKAYQQRQELEVLGGAMPTASSDVGDTAGLHLGDTTSGIRLPVQLDPNYPPSINMPSGLAITGQPGAGKTSATLLLTYQTALKGVQCVYIDPKGDAVPLASLPGMPSSRVLDLRNGDNGILDPFALGDDPSQSKLLAIETLTLLLGGQLEDSRESALLSAIDAVTARPTPTLAAVVDHLLASHDDASTALGRMLRTMSDLPFARLCFTPADTTLRRVDETLTIVTLLGLNLPSPDTDRNEYGYEERLSVALLYLVTRLARRLLLAADKNAPKAVIIDEAWALTATPQGQKLIPEIARMGRAHNTALVLVSQNAGDLMRQSVTNCLSTVLAFRSTQDDEITDVLSLLNIVDTPAHRATVRDLRNGECLMRDVHGRLARVQVDIAFDDLRAAFDTNPSTRGHHADIPADAARAGAA